MHLPPVHVAILAFHGTRPLAAAINRPFQCVQEWARPSGDGGRDGEFPSPPVIRQVIIAAKCRGIGLEATDLVFGRDYTDDELSGLMSAMPRQARAAWWPLRPEPEPEPAVAAPRGR